MRVQLGTIPRVGARVAPLVFATAVAAQEPLKIGGTQPLTDQTVQSAFLGTARATTLPCATSAPQPLKQ